MNTNLGRRLGFAILPILGVLAACSVPNESADGTSPAEASSDPAARTDVRASLSTDKVILGGKESVNVSVTLRNDTTEPVRLLKWQTLSDGLKEPLFTLTHDGQAVKYEGRHYKYGTPRESDYLVLGPGESLTRSVDLAQYYDMSAPGAYDVQYNVDAIASNHVRLQAESHIAPSSMRAAGMRLQAAQLAGSISYSGGCTASEQTDISNGFSSAKTYANASVDYLNGTPSATTRYTTWFGTYSTANWNEIKGDFANIQSAYDNENFVFDCSCTDDYFAYVYPDSPYKVYLCNAFWSAAQTGTDSKAGTIIHETSHFTVVAGTDDNAYGQSACKNLANSNPASARDNADSHEYFAENTPHLD